MDQSLQCLRSEVVAMATEALAITGFRTSRNDSRLLTQEKLCGIVGEHGTGSQGPGPHWP